MCMEYKWLVVWYILFGVGVMIDRLVAPIWGRTSQDIYIAYPCGMKQGNSTKATL
jgi:hypothetical protein